MTEMSPVGAICSLSPRAAALPREQRRRIQVKQGRPPWGVDMKIVDEQGNPLPHDGTSSGLLMVRGPWVASGYFRDDEATADAFHDGWFSTGDVATIDEHGYVEITDRAKDVIKSGGEWISSLDVENTLMAHPGVAEATVVGLKHLKWQERPAAFVVRAPGSEVTEEELDAHLSEHVAKWWLPDKIVFVDEIPKTGTGKFDKKVVRDQYADLLMEG
jgi:fatty-acyl-CoA synthase